MLDELPSEILSNIVYSVVQLNSANASDHTTPTFPQDRIVCASPANLLQPLSLTNYRLRQICIPHLFEHVQLNFLSIWATRNEMPTVHNVLDHFNELLKSRRAAIVESIRHESSSFCLSLSAEMTNIIVDGFLQKHGGSIPQILWLLSTTEYHATPMIA